MVGQEESVEKFTEEFNFSGILETDRGIGDDLAFVPRHFDSRELSVLRNAHLIASI